MGFRKDAYATVWDVRPGTDTRTSCRISVSKKNKQTDQYEQDFSGFVDFVGSAAANKALSLKPKDRIKLIDVDVSTKYVAERNMTYTNFKVFNFDVVEGQTAAQQPASRPNPASFIDVGVDGAEVGEEELPF